MKNLLITLSIIAASTLPILQRNVDVHSTNFAPDLNEINYSQTSQQEVENYYSSLEVGEKGDELLTDLQNILKVNQEKVNYNSGYTEGKNSSSWYGYYLYERNWELSPLEDSEKNGDFKTSGIWINVLYVTSPIYIEEHINTKGTTYKYYSAYPDTNSEIIEGTFSGSAGLDREHIFPKSFGFNTKDEDGKSNDGYQKLTAGCDAHNLHAGDRQGNQQGHNNLPFGNVVNKNNAEKIVSNLTGEISGYVGIGENGTEVFEPLDKDKGDIARSIFYMCARYHTYEDLGGGDETPALALGNGILATKTIEPSETKDSPAVYGELDDLLKWNILDPVSEYEIQRNDLIYHNIQGNRNPFVDYPDWASACFDPTNSTGIDFSNFNGQGPQYKFTVSAKESFKSSYNFLDKFSLNGLESTLVSPEGEIVEPQNITYYLNDKEIHQGDTVTSIGENNFYALARTSDNKQITSNFITINVGFSTTQIIIALAVIAVILVILIIIFAKLSKKNKNKVKKAIKKSIKKRN